MRTKSLDYSAIAERTIEGIAAAYNATLQDDDTEYQLAVRGLPRLIESSLLTDGERDVLRMYYGDGMIMREIGDALGIGKSQVSRRLRKANSVIAEIYTAIFPRFAAGPDPKRIRRHNFPKKSQLTFDRLSPEART
jgi:DNA-directed RNA polymerase specialized sigma subunit